MAEYIEGAGEDQIVQSHELRASHEQIQSAIAKLVWKNKDMREKILKEPKQTLEKELGIQFDENIHVHVIDQTEPHTVYFVLPHHPSKALGVELTHEQLDAIAGGGFGNVLGAAIDIGLTVSGAKVVTGAAGLISGTVSSLSGKDSNNLLDATADLGGKFKGILGSE